MPSDTLSRTHVLKQGETFAVFDIHGDINPVGPGEGGLYHEGTRFLSHLVFQLGKTRPVLLSSAVREDNALLTVDLTNPDSRVGDTIVSPHGTLHLQRTKFLWQGVCYDRLSIRNYGSTLLSTTLSLQFDADYADIFEVRGAQRPHRGRLLEVVTERGHVLLGYEGLDGLVRQTRLVFAPAPAALADREAQFEVSLPPKGEATFDLTIVCEPAGHEIPALSFDHAATRVERSLRTADEDGCLISTSNEQFNAWLRRSRVDLAMLAGPTPHGPYPYAGIPWFSTPFGRDGLITALACLWIDPGLARGVLASWPRPRRMRSTPVEMQSRVRSCTKPAKAKWLPLARSHSAATTALSTPPRSSSCSLGHITSGRTTVTSSSRSGPMSSRPWAG